MQIIIFLKHLGIINKKNHINANDPYRKIADDIRSKIEGYNFFGHTDFTNVIYVDAKWKGDQISRNLEIIKNNPNVTNFQIYYDPMIELEQAVNQHDIFKAYSLGCTLFESYGKNILKKYFDKNNVHISNEKMEAMNLQSVIIMLYTNKIIDNKFYNDITMINKLRNQLIIHKDITEELDIDTLEKTTEYIDRILVYANKLKSGKSNMLSNNI